MQKLNISEKNMRNNNVVRKAIVNNVQRLQPTQYNHSCFFFGAKKKRTSFIAATNNDVYL